MNTNQYPVSKNDIFVKVTYRNEDLVPVCIKEYALGEYTDLLKNNLMRIITDVEDVLYEATGRQKDGWSPAIAAKFGKIKHKLLDNAGEISRLPINIDFKVDVPVMMDELPGDVREIFEALRNLE